LPASKAFKFFLKRKNNEKDFTFDDLKTFSKLDDYDVLSAIKEWISFDDKLLSKLAESLINRKLPKVILQNEPFSEQQINDIKLKVKSNLNLTDAELNYFVFNGEICNQAYDSTKNSIKILFKKGEIKDIITASDHLNIQALSSPVYKYYLCYPKNR